MQKNKLISEKKNIRMLNKNKISNSIKSYCSLSQEEKCVPLSTRICVIFNG